MTIQTLCMSNVKMTINGICKCIVAATALAPFSCFENKKPQKSHKIAKEIFSASECVKNIPIAGTAKIVNRRKKVIRLDRIIFFIAERLSSATNVLGAEHAARSMIRHKHVRSL